jgi:hypothetical protein
MASEVLAGCAAHAEAMYRCTRNKMSIRIPATAQALNKPPKSFRSDAYPQAVVPQIFKVGRGD